MNTEYSDVYSVYKPDRLGLKRGTKNDSKDPKSLPPGNKMTALYPK
jgi:hypothetical protein